MEIQSSEIQASAKVTLAMKVNSILESRGLSQVEAGELLGMPQSKISALRNCKLRGISLERLLQALTDLGQHVDIVIQPSSAAIRPGVRVAA